MMTMPSRSGAMPPRLRRTIGKAGRGFTTQRRRGRSSVFILFCLFTNSASCARASCGDDPAFLMFTRFLPGAVECLGDMGQCGVGSSCSSAPATGKSSHAGPWDRVVPMLLRGGVCRRNRDWTAPHGPVLARWWSSSHSWTTITPPWCRIVVLLAALGVTCQSTEGAYPLLVRASCGPELAKRLPACLFFPITKQYD